MVTNNSYTLAQFRAARREFSAWLRAMRQQGNLLAQIHRESRLAGKKLLETALHLPHSRPRWTLLPLPDSAPLLLEARARAFNLPPISPEMRQFLQDLQRKGISAYRNCEALAEEQNSILNPHVRAQAEAAADQLMALYERGKALDFSAHMSELAQACAARPEATLTSALSEQYGLIPLLTLSAENSPMRPGLDSPSRADRSPVTPALEDKETNADAGETSEFSAANLPATEFADLPKIVEKLDALARLLNKMQTECLKNANALREEFVKKELEKIPVAQLQDIDRRRMKISALEEAGITTAAQVADLGWGVSNIAGLGESSASHILSALRALHGAILEETPIRLDPQQRSPLATELLQSVYAWYHTRQNIGHARALSFAASIKPHAYYLGNNASRLLIIGRARPAEYFTELLTECRQLAATYPEPPTPSTLSDTEIWEHFLSQPASYYAQMAEIGILTSDSEKIRGELPAEIVERVNALQLHTDYLQVPLRGYQNFGARFALAQRKVILGDEMGLGKTIEALAVAAHLFEEGKQHFLVICPASVLSNWLREIAAKTDIPSYQLHGSGRSDAMRQWKKLGGIALTTYETLGWLLQEEGAKLPDISCTIVDEAHYIKNPVAKRSLRTAHLIAGAEYAILLSGTPLENKIEEFRTLVHYVRPDLAISASPVPRKFRRQVAPAYLRRTQKDTLTELPDLVEVEEWLQMTPADEAAYREAVASGNFMSMRQAAMLSTDSGKLARLQEIVAEAGANGKKIIIYSYFRNVLQRLENEIPISFGPLTGSVSPQQRQQLVDDFSAAPPGAVLLAQIMAGGVGLNIQAASVVIICEPQLKPTTEWQAIARAHRMGQLETVQVHRLINETGVDEQIFALLQGKSALFQKFAHISDTARASELFQLESAVAEKLLDKERQRLGITAQSPTHS
ncbi:DEAD/DEAH box helicase [Arcanobacterium urinimassiliense]|uniref:DEAD/DEAH box helicase n=1 Tax=Arcanobacterium urinimassiliense TaxID=1871014 RepID=UPI00093D3B01|nr:DEAD/DEAH box helicase [Arcanobacterium urinimassiliense]